jgi:hypothetical protein
VKPGHVESDFAALRLLRYVLGVGPKACLCLPWEDIVMELAVVRSAAREAAEGARHRGHELPWDETLDERGAAPAHLPENGEIESVRSLTPGQRDANEGAS